MTSDETVEPIEILEHKKKFDTKINTFNEKNQINQPEVQNIIFSIFGKFTEGNQKRILQDLLMLFKFDENNAIACFEKSIFFNWVVKYLYDNSKHNPNNQIEYEIEYQDNNPIVENYTEENINTQQNNLNSENGSQNSQQKSENLFHA